MEGLGVGHQKEQQERDERVSGADSRSGSNTAQIRKIQDTEIQTKPKKRQWCDRIGGETNQHLDKKTNKSYQWREEAHNAQKDHNYCELLKGSIQTHSKPAHT